MNNFYNSYRGSRRKKHRRLLIVLLILLLLISLTAAAFFILQDHIVFTSDGFYFDFQKPKAETHQSSGQAQEGLTDDVPLVIGPAGSDNPASTPQTGSDPNTGNTTEPGNTSDPSGTEEPFAALLATPAQVIAGITLPKSYNALAVSVKGEDGIMWVSDAMAAENGAAAQADDFRTALSSVTAYKIAVVTALRDPLRPRAIDRRSAVKVESGSTWLDWNYCSWFNPYASGTADYLKDLLQSCADAGFDEVVLLDFQFPTHGKTDLISYGDQALGKAEALASLAKQLKRDDLKVSCLLTDTAAGSGTDTNAGQDAALLRDAFGKVWVKCAAPGDASALRTELGDDAVALWLTAESTDSDLPDHIVGQ